MILILASPHMPRVILATLLFVIPIAECGDLQCTIASVHKIKVWEYCGQSLQQQQAMAARNADTRHTRCAMWTVLLPIPNATFPEPVQDISWFPELNLQEGSYLGGAACNDALWILYREPIAEKQILGVLPGTAGQLPGLCSRKQRHPAADKLGFRVEDGRIPGGLTNG